MNRHAGRRAVALVFLLPGATPAPADEGMWTFDNPPVQRLQERYGFTPSPEWLDRIRLASVRDMAGGSGSFVSPAGLIVTNHHVASGCIQDLSSPEKDYVSTGYLAASRGQELACPGYEVNVVTAVEDVTATVLGAVRPEMSDVQAREARQAAVARLETECARRTDLRCDAVVLYQGGEYHLYTYRKYNDVRLVFAPEQQAAFFGGDPDNFTFPRFALDVAFLRAYEGGRPAASPAFLPWSRRGVSEGDLVFVSGNPGSTSRLHTVAQLESVRDVRGPFRLEQYRRVIARLRAYGERGAEQKRRAGDLLLSLENSQKAWTGQLDAVRDTKAMAEKAAAEKALREKVAADPALARSTAGAWTAIEAATRKGDERYRESRLLSTGGFSKLLGIARTIVRLVEETAKPNEARLPEFTEARLPSLQTELFSTAPLYDDFEELLVAEHLEHAREALGAEHPYVKAALGGRSPAEAAREAASGSRLDEVEVRKALVSGGRQAVARSADPLIALARRTEPALRELRRFEDEELQAPLTRAGQKIAEARFKIYGRTVYPDATFTLRLAYGTVKGYPAEGTLVAPFTTLHGLYDRAAAFAERPPWDLPPRWKQKKGDLALETPFDFVSTADIIGGNSGSPTIDRQGELVGVIFDGNIHSLAFDYFYTEEKARAISVDGRAILEALRDVYGADDLVAELTGR